MFDLHILSDWDKALAQLENAVPGSARTQSDPSPERRQDTSRDSVYATQNQAAA